VVSSFFCADLTPLATAPAPCYPFPVAAHGSIPPVGAARRAARTLSTFQLFNLLTGVSPTFQLFNGRKPNQIE
jgi:hypothetical protein